MKHLPHLFANNARWAEHVRVTEPDFFQSLSALQAPEYLWIGCADSRVPANQITGLKPGEVFVHRNVANVVVHTDLNCLSVMQYAIEVLHIKHIMVVGHYGCGGVRAALEGGSIGLIDNWLRHIQDVLDRHQNFISQLPDQTARWQALCELNVVEQVRNVALNPLLHNAWRKGKNIVLHGWVYSIEDGLLKDLAVSLQSTQEIDATFRTSIAGIYKKYEMQQIAY